MMSTATHTSEAWIQESVRDTKEIQRYIIDNLGFEYDGSERFVREVKFINGITVDFKIVKDNKVIALMECKRGDINVTEYVRGIGQLLQYEYFNEQKIERGEEYSDSFQTVYLIPSDIIKNKNFNIGSFKYPQSTKLLELNIDNYLVRQIQEDELEKLAEADNQKIIISQYYFRDNRFYELYILLQYLKLLKARGIQSINRKDLELNRLRKIETPNNNNWRNAFITLSTLGFINRGNEISETGEFMAIKNYGAFCSEIYHSYAKPYIDLLYNAVLRNRNGSLSNIKDDIERHNNGKQIVFLTDSDNRYLSSWLNIMRDDLGCVEFTTRSNDRTPKYAPSDLDARALTEKINSLEQPKQYINRYLTLVRNGEL